MQVIFIRISHKRSKNILIQILKSVILNKEIRWFLRKHLTGVQPDTTLIKNLCEKIGIYDYRTAETAFLK